VVVPDGRCSAVEGTVGEMSPGGQIKNPDEFQLIFSGRHQYWWFP